MSTTSNDAVAGTTTSSDPGRGVCNLTFHGVGEPMRRLGPGELDVWIDEDRLSSILDAVAGRDDVRISFDDGNASDVLIALAQLRRRGLTATFFVVSQRLGLPGFLDEEDLVALVGEGMTIGCHGMHHRPWRGLGDLALREETWSARQRLEAIVDRPVTQAACPFGAYDRRVLSQLSHLGYGRVFTSDGGPARAESWLQPRTTIRRGDRADVLERIVAMAGSRRQAFPRLVKSTVKRWR